MADNVQITAGSGTIIETIDEGSGVERQVVVLGSIGKAGSETQLTAGQKTATNSVPVVVASDQSAVPVSGTFWPSTQPVSGSVTANAGINLNTSALALETGGNLATIAGTVSGAKVQITVATALPVGSNTIGGTLAAPTSSSSFAITPGASSALESGHVLKASAGNLYSLYVYSSDVDGYLMTFNASSIPPDGPVTPVEFLPVFAGSSATIDFTGSIPDYYSAGIVAVFSTTGPFAKAGSSTAFFKWRVQ
jgi:hypothetical protein